MSGWLSRRSSGAPGARGFVGILALLMIGILAPTGCSPASVLELAQPQTTSACRNAVTASNPIAAENTCPGTSSWRRDLPAGPIDSIAAFTDPVSVAAGDRIQLYATTTALAYTYTIYRMGYYQGLGGRMIYQSAPITGFQQPQSTLDPATRTVECPWTNPVAIQTHTSWVSGVYVIKLVTDDGFERYALFVVRDPHPRAPILYSLPFTTYEAYNHWGAYSLYYYTAPKGAIDHDNRSLIVSFDRPFDLGMGLGLFGVYDFPLLNWMESQSYDMSYIADLDLNAPTADLNQFKLIISSGHAEYWSSAMRDSVTKARDAGVSLAFFGGNQMYWHVRFQSSAFGADRRVICYRYANQDPLAATDPTDATVRWRDPPLDDPEALLIGQQYAGILLKPATLQLTTGSAPFLTGTLLTSTSSFPNLVAVEYDRVVPGMEPAHLQILASSLVLRNTSPKGDPDTSNTTIYTAPSGARVFDSGTFGWSWGLSDMVTSGKAYPNASFQRFTANILAYLLRKPSAPLVGPA